MYHKIQAERCFINNIVPALYINGFTLPQATAPSMGRVILGRVIRVLKLLSVYFVAAAPKEGPSRELHSPRPPVIYGTSEVSFRQVYGDFETPP